MFKLAVEIAIMQNLVALQQDIDPLSLERLRGDCVKEVKRLNGSFSFEDALDWQKRLTDGKADYEVQISEAVRKAKRRRLRKIYRYS